MCGNNCNCKRGLRGYNGLSAYEVAVENGFIGTEEQWLESLVGPQGEPGTNGTNGTNAFDVYPNIRYILRAIYTQISTNDPTQNYEIIDTLPAYTFTRTGVGNYELVSNNLFSAAYVGFKLEVSGAIQIALGSDVSYYWILSDADTLFIATYVNGVASDDVLRNSLLELEIY